MVIKTCRALGILFKVWWKRHDFFTAVMSAYGWFVYEQLGKRNKVIVSKDTLEWLLKILTNKKIEVGKYENLEILADYRLNDISKGDVILDIGAGAGLYSLLSSLVAKKAYMLEPDIPFYEYVSKNPKIEILRDLSFGKCNELIKSSYWNSKGVVNSGIDLERILEEHEDITVVKCDCEGCEWDGFLSCDNFKNIQIINMEYHTNNKANLNKLCSLLQEHGFFYTIKQKSGSEFDYIGIIYARRKTENETNIVS